jgi:dTDP-glucose 4,6-dehydratase
MKNILVTGGAGFIGAHLIPYWLEQHSEYQLINLDKLTYAGNLVNLLGIASHPRYDFVQGDITDQALLHRLFQKFNFQGVIHLAAESHVDKSIQNPAPFVKTNLEGTFMLLEVARLHWLAAPGIFKPSYASSRFLHVSTDEVYGSLGEQGCFTEASPYAPNNPYSATKAGSDLLVRSYVKTYGFPAITTHCSNNYGPKQHDEKLIPSIIRHALAKQKIPIHGQGEAIRDWLYVLDHCKGLDKAFHQGEQGEHYNFGGNNEYTNLQIAQYICSILDDWLPLPGASYHTLVNFVADRPGNDQRYAINTYKSKNMLGWEPAESFVTGLRKTIQWYIDKYKPHENLNTSLSQPVSRSDSPI